MPSQESAMAKPKKQTTDIVEQRRHLDTAHLVVVHLGGHHRVARLTGCANISSVSNWITWGKFPSRYYAVMLAALTMGGFTAPHRLWDQRGNHKLAAMWPPQTDTVAA
jgi:hypothetical protein